MSVASVHALLRQSRGLVLSAYEYKNHESFDFNETKVHITQLEPALSHQVFLFAYYHHVYHYNYLLVSLQLLLLW